MSRTEPAGLAMLVASLRWATLLAVLMLALSIYTLVGDAPAGAGGSQEPPSLRPDRIEGPTDAFSLLPPAGARCEEDGSGRSGTDGWRWHTFIVEAGRDLSTLEFGPFGPGRDYDATDGTITASLIATGRGVWSRPPAEQPKGLIDPGDLGGLVLDPSDYTLRDGQYELGFACTDAASATRQWWSLEVTVQTTGAPFLTVDGDAPAATTDPAGATPTTTATAGTPAPLATTVDQEGATDGDSTKGAAAEAASADGPLGPTGVSWAPLVSLVDASSVLPVGGWAALVAVLARITYLLARPPRVLTPLAP